MPKGGRESPRAPLGRPPHRIGRLKLAPAKAAGQGSNRLFVADA